MAVRLARLSLDPGVELGAVVGLGARLSDLLAGQNTRLAGVVFAVLVLVNNVLC